MAPETGRTRVLSMGFPASFLTAFLCTVLPLVTGSQECWGGEFTSERCCDTSKGRNGDKSCWGVGYTFDFCCLDLSANSAKSKQSLKDAKKRITNDSYQQTFVRQTTKLIANVSSFIVPPLPVVSQFLTQDIPDFLARSAQALRKMKLPSTYSGFLKLSQSKVLDLAPVISLLVVVAVTPFALLHNDKRPRKAVAEPSESYWLTRLFLLRGLGLCYLCGFITSAIQHRALWGSKGLAPITPTFPGSRPSPVFEFLVAQVPWVHFDCLLEGVSWFGVIMSLLIIWYPVSSVVLPALLWISYLSIINLQAPFTYSYGWEWLTCEAGFLAMFLYPFPLGSRFPASTPPPRLVIWMFRWLSFRLLLGAGMSKVGRNSSACWRELTCTTTHYFTQPIPNPLSWFAHHAPDWVHSLEVALTFVEQLVVPFLMLVPSKWARRCAALLEMFFQFMIVATGNYAWINFIGAVPCLSMLDDAVLSWVVPRAVAAAAREAAEAATQRGAATFRKVWTCVLRCLHRFACFALVIFMVYKSKDPIKDLFSPAPWIHNYDKWFLMNSQGVFGFINTHRVQLVLEYTHGETRNTDSEWHPLDFKCIPGSTGRLPCILSPYHSRLDWETWIRTTASMEHLYTHNAGPQEYFNQFPDFLHELIMRILHGDEDSVGLMGVARDNVLLNGSPPKGIRARFYSYTFTSVDYWLLSGHWWDRKPLDDVGGIVFEASSKPMKRSQIRRTRQWRHHVMLLSVAGTLVFAAIAPLQGDGQFGFGGVGALLNGKLAVALSCLGFAGVLLLALLADYPKVYEEALRKLERFANVGDLGLPREPWETLRFAAHAILSIQVCRFLFVLVGFASGRSGSATSENKRNRCIAFATEMVLLGMPLLLLWFVSS